MTLQEAIKWLIGIEEKYIHGGDEVFDKNRKVAIKTAISALEKQIPKKLIINEKDGMRHCPNCDTFFLSGGKRHCERCGQALDWGEEDGKIY